MQAAAVGDRDLDNKLVTGTKIKVSTQLEQGQVTGIGSCRASERTRRDAPSVTNDRRPATTVLIFGNNNNGIYPSLLC